MYSVKMILEFRDGKKKMKNIFYERKVIKKNYSYFDNIESAV